MEVFSTPRLVIREWTHGESDVERMLDTYSRWEVARWLGTTPRPMETTEQAHSTVDRWNARRAGPYGLWAVEVRETGTVAGTVLLVPLPDATEVEVGWHLHPDAWGHGYATESARAALARGFAADLTEIFAVVRPENIRSLAVCVRLGMTPLGRTDRWYDTEFELFRCNATAAGGSNTTASGGWHATASGRDDAGPVGTVGTLAGQ